jgi:uncharacterized protein YjeT (DUF2065 family)
VTGLFVTCLGVVGFGLILLSTTASTRRKLLALDMAGTLTVALHYSLLGAGAGAAFSLSYALADAFGLSDSHLLRRIGTFLVFVGAVTLTIIVEPTLAGAFAVIGSAVAVGARVLSDPARMLLAIALSTVLWGAYGVFAGSTPQILFSVIYFFMALIGWWRLKHKGKSGFGLPSPGARTEIAARPEGHERGNNA